MSPGPAKPVDDLPAADRQALVRRAGELGASTLHEAAGRIGAMASAVATMTPGIPLAGWAFPVVSPPGDNLWLHRAVYAATLGSVLVVDVSDGHEFGYWGEILSHAALVQGVAGLVLDGGVRDTAQLRQIGLPVYARRRCIRGTAKDPAGSGALGVPAVVGGVRVHPGDLVVGDDDGVVVLPRHAVESVIAAGEARVRREADIITRLYKGDRTLELLDLTEPEQFPDLAD
jgi:4-hydroxy-4-methyl-2-oxoglutarate aldolase